MSPTQDCHNREDCLSTFASFLASLPIDTATPVFQHTARQVVEPKEVDAINVALEILAEGIEVRHWLTCCA